MMGSLETFHLCVSCTGAIFIPLFPSLSLCTPINSLYSQANSLLLSCYIYMYVILCSYTYT